MLGVLLIAALGQNLIGLLHEGFGKLTAQEMISTDLSAKDLHPFELPSYDEIEKTGVWGIHLGDTCFGMMTPD